jgi:hypothetical protein
MKHYSIMVCQTGADRESELCQVASNPQEIADAF